MLLGLRARLSVSVPCGDPSFSSRRRFFAFLEQEITALFEVVGVEQIDAVVAEFFPEVGEVRRAPEADEAMLLMGFGDDVAKLFPLGIGDGAFAVPFE